MKISSFRHLLIVAILTGISCTAWNYEAEACDPSVNNLTKDVCRRLNSSLSACMIYQCDGKTRECKLGPRDQDRDGDPDVACGGTDCNDFDPAIAGGANGMCACSASLLDMPCAVGAEGTACRRNGKYVCSNAHLTCSATAGTPDSQWKGNPSPDNSSWDWNCDGIISRACSYLDTNNTRQIIEACSGIKCNPNAQQRIIENQDATTICNSFNGLSFSGDRSIDVIVCSNDCGSPIVACQSFCSQSGGGVEECVIVGRYGSVYCK